MSNRAEKARKNLKERQEDFDLNLRGRKGFHRPGSQSAHKQATGAAKKGGRR